MIRNSDKLAAISGSWGNPRTLVAWVVPLLLVSLDPVNAEDGRFYYMKNPRGN
jgi:hypothetical protein